MIKFPKLCLIAVFAIFAILASKSVNAQVTTSTDDLGNLGAGPRVPNFCSLQRGKPCLSVGFAQGFNLDEPGTSSNLSIAGDILLNRNFSFVSGAGASLDGNGANLFSGIVARSKVKAKGLGYAIGPVFRIGFGLDDITTTTFANGSTDTEENDAAFFGVGGTGQLIFKPSDSFVTWIGTDLSKNIFDSGGVVFSSFVGSAFKITNTRAGVLAGTLSVSRTYGDVVEPSNGLGIGFVLFP